MTSSATAAATDRYDSFDHACRLLEHELGAHRITPTSTVPNDSHHHHVTASPVTAAHRSPHVRPLTEPCRAATAAARRTPDSACSATTIAAALALVADQTQPS